MRFARSARSKTRVRMCPHLSLVRPVSMGYPGLLRPPNAPHHDRSQLIARNVASAMNASRHLIFHASHRHATPPSPSWRFRAAFCGMLASLCPLPDARRGPGRSLSVALCGMPGRSLSRRRIASRLGLPSKFNFGKPPQPPTTSTAPASASPIFCCILRHGWFSCDSLWHAVACSPDRFRRHRLCAPLPSRGRGRRRGPLIRSSHRAI